MGEKKRTICLITPGHLASNPRLVKEARALSGAGYKVHLIFTQYVPYLIPHDQIILEENPEWTYDCLNRAGKTLKEKWLKYIPLFKLKLASVKFLSGFLGRDELQTNRNFYWQCRKAIAAKAGLYIAHNLGALPVAAKAASNTNTRYGFDAEDFHRFETSNDISSPDVKLKVRIEQKYLPKAAYVTAASPLIAKEYEQLFQKNITVVNNVFDNPDTDSAATKSGKTLKLFWFSQTIGPNRGLETSVEALNKISGYDVEFHLLGNLSAGFRKALSDKITGQKEHSLHFHKPVTQYELFKITRQFHLGLASEPGYSVNNDIALSNKLFTYIQCGLAVLLSDTPAQKGFFESYPGIGKLYRKNDVDSLAEAIGFYAKNRNALFEVQKHNLQLAKENLNWEKEKEKFLAAIEEILQ